LLVVFSGAEIMSTTIVSLGPTLRVGLGGVNGFVGTMITFVLAVCGLLLWFSPAQRVFYSIVAIVLALATFNTVNYGGFFLGMLLGIIGGALAFAWSPAAEKARSRRSGPGLGLVLGKLHSPGAAPGPAADPAPGAGPQSPPGSSDRTLSLVALPLVLSLALAPALHAQPLAPAHASQPRPVAHAQPVASSKSRPNCILFILCSPTRSPSPSGGPSPSPSPTSSTGTGKPGGSTSTTGNKPGAKKGKIKRTAAPHGLVASSVPTVLTASSAKLVGLAYEGVAEVPRATGGPLAMMKFTLDSVTLTGSPTLTIHENGSVGTTSTSLLSFSGNVVLYATKLSGDLLGVPITLTTSSPLSLVLQLLSPLTRGLTVTMTNVVTDQPVTTAAASRWSNFLISVRPS
jgi:hypothetical protein